MLFRSTAHEFADAVMRDASYAIDDVTALAAMVDRVVFSRDQVDDATADDADECADRIAAACRTRLGTTQRSVLHCMPWVEWRVPRAPRPDGR